MTQDGKSWGWQFGFVRAWAIGGAITLTGGLALSGNRALAQIIPDATLGAERSIVTPNANVKTLPADLIEGGALRGTNLFHSFHAFNVGNGQRVYFANPAGIENILSRVTGNNLSKIFGTLGVNGGANLFLLNPNGIIFGPNARLDISGSFVGSTANSLVWGNGYQFSAKNPQAPPMLTIKLRPGLQYGTNQPGATIANAGTLAVGKDLTLAAGNLDLQGQLSAGGNLTLQAQDTVRVRDSVTNPFVAAAGGQLLVEGDRTVDIFALNHPASGFFSGGDMVLKSLNSVIGDAHYTTEGNFRIEQLNGSLGNLFSPNDPIIRASGDVNFDTYTGTSLHILAGGSVTIGSITITGADATGNTINPTSTPILANVTLSDGTSLVIDGTTRPTLDIRAGTTAFGNPGIIGNNFTTLAPIPNTNAPATSASIDIGSITVTAPGGLVFLTNQYRPNPALTGNIQVKTIGVGENAGGFTGNGGDIIIDSRGDITIPDGGRIRTDSTNGKAGNIAMIANGSFFMTGGAQLDTSTFGRGNAGDININVRDAVSLTGGNTWILSFVKPGAVANSGTINIQAGSLSLTNGGGIFSAIRGQGNGGDININVGNAVAIDGVGGNSNSGLFATISQGGVGKSGNINLEAGDLFLTNGGTITNFLSRGGSPGQGTAGDININVRNTITIAGVRREPIIGGLSYFYVPTSGVYSTVGNGAAGNIYLRAGALSITDGGVIDAGTEGQGKAGNITINVRDSFTLAGVNADKGFSSRLFALTGTTGQGGNITVSAGTFRIADGAVVNASTLNSGNGGDITVNANVLELTGGGQILALPYAQGNGGNVTLNVSDRLTISGNDPTFTDRLGRFGLNVVTNQGPTSGIYTGYAIGLVEASLGFPVKSTGNGGNISIIGPRELTVDGGELFTGAFNTGNAGTLSITQTGSVNLDNLAAMLTSTLGTGNAGRLFIDTGKLNLQNQSFIISTTTGAGDAGELTIHANDSVDVISGSEITSETRGSGNGGTLTIETGTLTIRDSSEVSANTSSSGQGGTLRIRASDSVNLVNGGFLVTASYDTGNSGNLFIDTGRLSILNSSVVSTSTKVSGDAGKLNVRAADLVEVVNGSKLSADTFGSGNGGDLTIDTRRLVTTNAEVSTGAGLGSSGRGGNLLVKASDSVEISGLAGLSTSTQGSGRGGDLTVETARLSALEGGRLEAGTLGFGLGGTVRVNASESIELIGFSSVNDKLLSGISAFNSLLGDANSGDVNLTTGKLIIQDGAEVTTAAFVYPGFSATPDTLGAGNAGNIQVQANSVSIGNRGRIASRNEGRGFAGNVNLSIKDTLQTNGGEISASADRSGGGDITINADDIRLRNGSLVSSSVFDSTGGGGNITINSGTFLALEDSDILANAEAGPGGNITIKSPAFLADLFFSGKATPVGRNPGSFAQFRGNGRVDISADSQTGTSGTVSLPTIDPTRGLTQLPTDLVDAERLIDRRCTPSGAAKRSSFTVTGRGGLPPSPNEPLRGEAVIADWITLNAEPEKRDRPNPTPHPTSATPTQLVEAQGWVIGPNGEVILTAQAPTVTPQNPGLTVPPCQGSHIH